MELKRVSKQFSIAKRLSSRDLLPLSRAGFRGLVIFSGSTEDCFGAFDSTNSCSFQCYRLSAEEDDYLTNGLASLLRSAGAPLILWSRPITAAIEAYALYEASSREPSSILEQLEKLFPVELDRVALLEKMERRRARAAWASVDFAITF